MLPRVRHLFALLLLLALPLKGVAGLLMVGCAGMALPAVTMAASTTPDAAGMPPCHGADEAAAHTTAEASTVNAGCCHCGPCLAPMAGFEPPPVLAATPMANATPAVPVTLPAGRSAEPPQPPPRS